MAYDNCLDLITMNAHRSFVWRCCGCKEDHDVREGVVIAFVRDDRNGSRSVAKLNHDVEFGAEPSNRSALRYSYIVVGLDLSDRENVIDRSVRFKTKHLSIHITCSVAARDEQRIITCFRTSAYLCESRSFVD